MRVQQLAAGETKNKNTRLPCSKLNPNARFVHSFHTHYFFGCSYVTDNAEPNRHVIASNEGASVAIATGYHLATKRFPLVYLQNSGFGNTVNPLLSLVDPQVYR